jgi:hypothetical protein
MRFTLIISWNTQKVTAFFRSFFFCKKVALPAKSLVLNIEMAMTKPVIHTKGVDDRERQHDASFSRKIHHKS